MNRFIASLLFGLITRSALALNIVTVPVGDVGNPNDPATGNSSGGVGYPYNIGRTEVTVGQYTAFLNAAAAADPYLLWSPGMQSELSVAGISRSGSPGSYTYAVIGSANHPAAYVNFGKAARFVNWLHNGQPTGAEGPGTTETGSYFLNGSTDNTYLTGVTRNPGATWVIPSDNEWYKAAYYQPAAAGGDSDGYWDIPTRSNAFPYSDQPPGATPNNTRVANIFADDSTANGYDDGFAVTGSPTFNFPNSQNYLTDVGAYTLSPSFYGTFDQAGNLQEWTEGADFPSGERIVRGGSWFEDEATGASAQFTIYIPTQTGDSFTGFRVVEIPKRSVTAWRSRRTHNGTPLSIVLNPTSGNGVIEPTVETRSGGIQNIAVDFSLPVTGANAANVDVNDGVHPTIHPNSASTFGNTLTLTFNAGVLLDQTCYTMTLNAGAINEPMTGDLDCRVRSLVGDTTGDGKVNLSDVIYTATKTGSATANPMHDVNLSGIVDSGDWAVAIKSGVISPPRHVTVPGVITPASAFASTYYSGGQPPVNLINNSGLNTSSGNVMAFTHAPDPNAFGMWHAGQGQGIAGAAPVVANQYVVFDLGANYNLTRAYLWEMVQPNLPGRGIKQFRLLASPNPPNPADAANPPASYNLSGFVEIRGTSTLAQSTGPASNPDPAITQLFTLTGAANVRQVYLNVITCYSGLTNDYVGLSEVKFEGTPSSAP